MSKGKTRKEQLLRQVSKIAMQEDETTAQDLRKLSFFMGTDEVKRTINVYYCTEHGKVLGKL